MSFREISIMDIWEIIRRWHDGQGIREIARSLGYDRNTVRRYTRLAVSIGWLPREPLPPRDQVLSQLSTAKTSIQRVSQAQTVFMPYLDEIVELINDPQLALKPKTAFMVICERHDLSDKVSYTSFKRFVASHRAQINPSVPTCRFETLPGREIQIDYARVGLLLDTTTSRRRTLYAFIGTLSHSRFKYIELTFSQDQTSFVSSHVRMFEFFGGVPERLVIDNLKSGVLKPDLYDPSFNRSYRDMAEYYGCFIDPARIRKPKDKGKVERDVQTVREAVRKTLVLNPTMSLAELNQAMKTWMHDDYGQRLHGTTREKPVAVFTERERPAFKPLPAERFEIAVWKQATVHPDHYIQFRGKAFSVPSAYVTKKVWMKATEHLLSVFYDEQLIAQHIITKAYRHTDYTHFPDNVRTVLDRSTFHKNLLERSHRIGPDFHDLIRHLFDVDAFINFRRAQGLIAAAEEAHDANLINRAARFMHDHRIRATPRELRCILEKLRIEHEHQQYSLALTDVSHEFVRDITYFINTQDIES